MGMRNIRRPVECCSGNNRRIWRSQRLQDHLTAVWIRASLWKMASNRLPTWQDALSRYLKEIERLVKGEISKMGQIKVEKNAGGIEGLCVIEPAVHGDAQRLFHGNLQSERYGRGRA